MLLSKVALKLDVNIPKAAARIINSDILEYVLELLPICQRLNTTQEGIKFDMYLKESSIDNPRMSRGKILNNTIPAPSKINDGINKMIFATTIEKEIFLL